MLTELIGLLKNPIFHAALLAWMIAQLVKIVIELCVYKRLNVRKLVSSGGMPSSHSALVASVSVSVGMLYGFDSAFFIACAVFAFIVMYDACNVRRAAGEQAQALNQLLDEHGKFESEEDQLREILGHKPLEVAAGVALGIVIALIVTPH